MFAESRPQADIAHDAQGSLVCPRCRRVPGPQDGRRCPVDQAFFVTRAALVAVGRDAYLGELIGGRYAILERLGMGGMGTVYRARDERTGSRVAVKFLRDEYASHRAIRARFVREAEAGVSIDSPYVVRMLDFGVDADRTLYIVMEYVEGWTLRDEVNNNGAFSVRHAREVARQLLRGLADAHDVGLVHRDLKHDNVMFHGHRDRCLARILDFGVVKIDAEDTHDHGRQLTAAGAMVGSPSYMAPEQIRGLAVGPPADLYALAVVLYEAMTARRLFPVNNYEALLRASARRDAPPLLVTGIGEHVPPDFNRILMRALAHDPKDRFADARTMLLAFEQMDMGLTGGPGASVADLLSDAPGNRGRRPLLRIVSPCASPEPATPATADGAPKGTAESGRAPAKVAEPVAAPAVAGTPDVDDDAPTPAVHVTLSPAAGDPTPGYTEIHACPEVPALARTHRRRAAISAAVFAFSAVAAYAVTRVIVG